jgi:hypothetical protein
MYCVSVYMIARVNVLTSLPQLKLPAWYSYAHAAVTAIACVLVWLVTKAPPVQSNDADEDSTRMWIRFFAVCGALVAGFIFTDLAGLTTDARRTWSVCADLFAAAEEWLFWTYLGRCVDRIPDERLARRCHSMKWGRTLGIVFGPVLGTLVHRQAIFSVGFRIFAPMPGRVCLIAYELIGIVLLVRIARRVVQLKAVPIIK